MKLKLLMMAASIAAGICSAAEKPNVLFIAIDDLNTSPHIMHGETTVYTPNLEKLANRGILFTNAHCAAPACGPSRAAVISGLAPATTGVYINPQDWRKNPKLKNWTTIPHYFQQNGYTTMGGGKIYHACTLSKEKYTGFLDARPWDEYFPNKERQMPWEVLPEKIPTNTHEDFYGGRFDWAELDIDTDDMADAQVVKWASDQLSKTHDKPLFLGVGIYRPHIPWYTPKKYFDMHPLDEIKLPETVPNDLGDVPLPGHKTLKKSWHKWLVDHDKWAGAVRGYNASVSFTDDMIGRLLQALDNGPLADNTIVVLWTDHGYHLGQKEHWEKFALWEQTTRVPFIISAPGMKTDGQSSAEPVSLLDIYPTLNALCGFDPIPELDGKSLIPLLKNPALDTGRGVITTQGYKNHAVRTDRWRYIRYAKGEEELYDQLNDPKNFTNLASNPEYDGLKKELAAFLPAQDEPMNWGNTGAKKGKGKKKTKRNKS